VYVKKIALYRNDCVIIKVAPRADREGFCEGSPDVTTGHLVAEHVSVPLSEEVQVMLKASSNIHTVVFPVPHRRGRRPQSRQPHGRIRRLSQAGYLQLPIGRWLAFAEFMNRETASFAASTDLAALPCEALGRVATAVYDERAGRPGADRG